MYFLDLFNEHSFFVRDSLVLLLLALSIYVLLHAGLFAVPQVGFMAIGAYTAAIVSTKTDVGIAISLGLACVTGAIAGLVLAFVLVRLDGIYLAISTIAFGEIVRVSVRNLDIAGGGLPLVGVPRTLTDVALVGTILAVIAVLWRLARSRFGLAIVMMREDSLSAAHQGVSVRSYRVALFAFSGLLAGCAGGMFVHLTGFVEPGLFDFNLLVDALAATVLGGMTFVAGPVMGGLVIFALPEFLHAFAEYRTLVNGLLIVAVVAFAPDGLAAFFSQGWRRLTRRRVSRKKTSDFASTGAVPDLVPEPSATSSDGSESPAGIAVASVSGLAKNFGGIGALDGVDLDVLAGEVLGVIGPNGSGKTTLINVISGVYAPTAGVVHIADQPVGRSSGHPERMARLGISRTFQAIRLIQDLSVLENVGAGAYRVRKGEGLFRSLLGTPAYRRSRESTTREAERLLAELGLHDAMGTAVHELPYGQQRKVEIARALMSHPTLLLLDEPTAGMSPAERDEVFELIQHVRRRGVTVVVIEHDVRAMTENCDRLAVLNFGKVIIVDTPRRVMESEAVIDAYIGRSA